MKKWLVIDWETKSACDLLQCGSYRYAIDPTTEILCVSIGNSGGRATWRPGQPVPSIIHKAIAEGWWFIAHNSAFEREIWKCIATPEHGWPQCPPLEVWHDTMSRAYQLALPGALEDVLNVLDLDHKKDLVGSKLTIGLSKFDRKTGQPPVVTPEILDRVCAYCEEDISGEIGVFLRTGLLPEHERIPWIGAQEMNDRGLYFDLELVDAMQAVVDQAVPPLAREFAAITGGLKVGSPKFLGWLHERGVHLDNLRKETIAETLEGHEEPEESDAEDDEFVEHEEVLPEAELEPDVHRALRIRQLVGSASIKKLKTIKKVVCYDGRARGLLVYHRTTPGRGGATLIQPHNFPKPTLKVDKEAMPPEQIESFCDLIKMRDAELLEQTYGIGAVEIIVSGLRHTIMAQPGYVYRSGDYSGIQARVVLALAGQHDKTALLAGGVDVYIDMACDIIRMPKPDWTDPASFRPFVKWFKEAHAKERGLGKNSVLGLGFQMGGKTFRLKYAKERSIEFCNEVVRTYRKEWAPMVPKLWYAQQDAAVNTVWTGRPHDSHGIVWRMEDMWLTAEVPNGSKIYYANPQKTRRPVPWDDTDIRKGFRYQVMKEGVWRWRDAFGGQIVENLVMKIEREIMEDAKRRLRRYGYYPIVLEVHDENVAESPIGQGSLQEYAEILEDVEEWTRNMRIPIQVDCWEGPRYRK